MLAQNANSEQYEEKARTYLRNTLQQQLSDEAQLEAVLSSTVKMYSSPWFKYFIAYDPAPIISQIEVPVLAINGSNDLQVAAESNLGGIEQILSQAKHPDYTILSLDGLNHLLQPSDSGAPTEYVKITTTVDPVALNAMSAWLAERFN